jgi:hypothetical protein
MNIYKKILYTKKERTNHSVRDSSSPENFTANC